uniref:F-box domain-containing protein n=1 Tax=Mycena chlorophos TaxID=658473 RepID=A0ABQ0LFS2_MYCCL|nr:predicted protein [Mycena chlorophos]
MHQNLASTVVTAVLSRQLVYSRHYPLTIHYDSSRHSPLRGCLALLLENAHRWMDVSLQLDRDDVETFQNSSVAFPLLERLDVDFSIQGAHAPGFNWALHFPKISHLGLDGNVFSDLHLTPWKRLASLKLHAAAPIILDTLSLAPQLISANLSLSHPIKTQWTRPQVECSQLSVLEIYQGMRHGAEPHLISLLRAPALRELDFRSYTSAYHKPIYSTAASLKTFLSASRCSLTWLSYRGEAAEPAFLDALSLVPSLTYLAFEPMDDTIPHSFIRSLTQSNASNPLLPALIILELGRMPEIRKGDGNLREDVERMLRSRNAATEAGTLRSVTFEWWVAETDPDPLFVVPGLDMNILRY